jgi:hypothetical protein
MVIALDDQLLGKIVFVGKILAGRLTLEEQPYFISYCGKIKDGVRVQPFARDPLPGLIILARDYSSESCSFLRFVHAIEIHKQHDNSSMAPMASNCA